MVILVTSTGRGSTKNRDKTSPSVLSKRAFWRVNWRYWVDFSSMFRSKNSIDMIRTPPKVKVHSAINRLQRSPDGWFTNILGRLSFLDCFRFYAYVKIQDLTCTHKGADTDRMRWAHMAICTCVRAVYTQFIGARHSRPALDTHRRVRAHPRSTKECAQCSHTPLLTSPERRLRLEKWREENPLSVFNKNSTLQTENTSFWHIKAVIDLRPSWSLKLLDCEAFVCVKVE